MNLRFHTNILLDFPIDLCVTEEMKKKNFKADKRNMCPSMIAQGKRGFYICIHRFTAMWIKLCGILCFPFLGILVYCYKEIKGEVEHD